MNKTINKFKRHDDRLVGEKKKPVGRKGLRILGWGWRDPKGKLMIKGKEDREAVWSLRVPAVL